MKTITKLLTLAFFMIFQSVVSQNDQCPLHYCSVVVKEGNNHITNVRLSNLNHTSELGINGYSNFVSESASVGQGQEYDLTVTTKWEHWPYLTIQAWIDWNGNKSFESTERVLYKNGTGPISGQIAVPSNAEPGATRMRVRYSYDLELGPCEIDFHNNGEVEDYTIFVTENRCPSNNERPIGQYISEVEFSGVSNITTYNSGYEFYDFPNASVQAGPYTNTNEASVMSIKINQGWEATQVGVWVDWDQDGDFDDVAEGKILYKSNPTVDAWTMFFTVPAGAKLGNTIMRIRAVHGEELTPCGDAWFGETEDYSINVIAPRNNGHDSIPGRGSNPADGQSRATLVAQNVMASPNPSVDGVFNFNFDQAVENAIFRVFNDNGRMVHTSSNLSGDKIRLNLSSLKFGLYTVQVQTKDNLETVRILIK